MCLFLIQAATLQEALQLRREARAVQTKSQTDSSSSSLKTPNVEASQRTPPSKTRLQTEKAKLSEEASRGKEFLERVFGRWGISPQRTNVQANQEPSPWIAVEEASPSLPMLSLSAKTAGEAAAEAEIRRRVERRAEEFFVDDLQDAHALLDSIFPRPSTIDQQPSQEGTEAIADTATSKQGPAHAESSSPSAAFNVTSDSSFVSSKPCSPRVHAPAVGDSVLNEALGKALGSSSQRRAEEVWPPYSRRLRALQNSDSRARRVGERSLEFRFENSVKTEEGLRTVEEEELTPQRSQQGLPSLSELFADGPLSSSRRTEQQSFGLKTLDSKAPMGGAALLGEEDVAVWRLRGDDAGNWSRRRGRKGKEDSGAPLPRGTSGVYEKAMTESFLKKESKTLLPLG